MSGLTQDENGNPSLAGMTLIAMPSMPDPRFAKSVIYLCAYSEDGAMGLIINQRASELNFGKVVEQVGIDADPGARDLPVHVGGPVETSRGFVLHSTDYVHESTMVIDKDFALSATVDVLQAIGEGKGPARMVFALGYSGWAAGQLDKEIQDSGWLLAGSNPDLVFGDDADTKWTSALAGLGIDPSLLSGQAGHA